MNSQPINPPYVFDVVGDPDTLPANLLSSSIGEKWYALKDSLGFRFDVRNGGTMTLPAAPQPAAAVGAASRPTDDGRHTDAEGDSAP